ncbi:MAG: DUF1501 domain-containing protein [Gemmatales bacterium]|nr:DUF1501 domain-containing protein [Gemmatales bacterium]MDW8387988.1 DUF1501 domain-containing protein [Gemmatales bacterium]
MRHLAGFSLMAGPSLAFVQRLIAAAPQMKRDRKSLIILWMGGGPSHMDLWDMKPDSPNGGAFKPMKTAVSGIEICEHLPILASQAKHLAIVRSLVTNEGSHERGTYLLHTAYAQNPAIDFPSIGSIVNQQLTPKELAIPGFISVGRPAEGPGFLGMAYAPFTVQNPGQPPQNISPPSELGSDWQLRERLERRKSMFAAVETQFVKENRGEAAKAHLEVYRKAFDLTDSQLKLVFDTRKENNGRDINPKLADDYGRDSFGQGCLLARKLVEAGVSCVEVNLGGWDMHNNIFPALHTSNRTGNADRLDRGFGTLIKDLNDRGLLDSTVILWMGEFGRTPRINQNGGRDHWARCWSVVLAGGGIKGGQVYGSTDSDGTSVKDDPCQIGDVFATVYQALGINPDTEIRDPLGRPRKITGEKGGTPLKGLV